MGCVDNIVSFPEHMLVIGRTMSGKSSLVGEIFSNIDLVYNRQTKDNIILLLSPHKNVEDVFIGRFASREDWKILHFTVHCLSEEFMDSLFKYLEKERILGKELFMFMDDIVIGGCASKELNGFILKAFATFRHMNIAVIATAQVGDKEFRPLMENCGYVIIMKNFGYHKCLEMVLRNFVTSVKVPTLIRKIIPSFEKKEGDRFGDHIVLNFSSLAMRNKIFFISGTIFNPYYGYTRKNIEDLCLLL